MTDPQLVEQLSEYYRLHTQAIRFLSFFRRFHSIQHLPEFGGSELNGAKPERDKEFGRILKRIAKPPGSYKIAEIRCSDALLSETDPTFSEHVPSSPFDATRCPRKARRQNAAFLNTN